MVGFDEFHCMELLVKRATCKYPMLHGTNELEIKCECNEARHVRTSQSKETSRATFTLDQASQVQTFLS